MKFIGRHVLNLVGMIALTFMFCMNAIAIASYMGITSGTLPGLGTYEIVSTGDMPAWLVLLSIFFTIYVYTVVVRWCARGPVAKARAQLMEKMDKVRGELADEEKRCERAIANHNDTIRTLRALQEKFEALQNAQDLPATAEAAVEKMTELLEAGSGRVADAELAIAEAGTALAMASMNMQGHATEVQGLLTQVEERARTVLGALGDDTGAKKALMATGPEVAPASVTLSEDDRGDIGGLLRTLKKMQDNGDLEDAESTLVSVFEGVAKRHKSRKISVEQYLVVLWVLGTAMVEYAANLEEEGSELTALVERHLPAFAEAEL